MNGLIPHHTPLIGSQPVRRGPMSDPILTLSEQVELIAEVFDALRQPLPFGDCAPTRDIERLAIERVLAAHRNLSHNGFWCWCGRTYGMTREKFDADRAKMACGHAVGQFRRSVALIMLFCGRRKTMSRKRTSYGVKHLAESTTNLKLPGSYVSNGMFIVAAIALDYRVEQIDDTPNAWLNLDVIREVSR